MKRPISLERSPSTTGKLLASLAETTQDGGHVAPLVANIFGGLLVVVGVASSVVSISQRISGAVPSSLSEYAHGRVYKSSSQLSVWEWSTSDLQSHQAVEVAKGFCVVVSGALLLGCVLVHYKQVAWFCWLQLGVITKWLIAIYQLLRVSLSVSVLIFVKTVKRIVLSVRQLNLVRCGRNAQAAAALRRLMKNAESYAEWTEMAEKLDHLESKEEWKTTISPEDHEHCDFIQLNKNIHDLIDAIESRNIEALKYMLPSFIMRNKLGVDTADLHLHSSSGTKEIIDKHSALIVQALELLSNATPEELDSDERARLFRKLKQAFGSSALCLSGGGAIAMYHIGTVKALLDADLLPNVISGSSGGSIVAAFTACNTNEELYDKILVNDVSTRFIPDGIQWFPPLMEQLKHFAQTGYLVESSEFERTTQQYYGEPFNSINKTMHYTFQDAFLKTGRHVCITVSASDVTGHKGPKKLLLNHINTPHVLLWSAVAVSCSLPGIMKGKKLMARDHEGNVVPYDAMGKEWVDGSIQHDLPMETMASCFNVTNFIVSQVNPHVVPFMGDDVHAPVFRKSLFHTLESVIAADVRHRLKMLAFLGLFPKIYGHQFSSYFKQNFSGHVTLIPDFIFSEAIGIKAILNPTREDMDRYLLGGQRAVWPKLSFIGHLCAIEKCLDRCLSAESASPSSSPSSKLVRARSLKYDNWLHPTRTA